VHAVGDFPSCKTLRRRFTEFLCFFIRLVVKLYRTNKRVKDFGEAPVQVPGTRSSEKIRSVLYIQMVSTGSSATTRASTAVEYLRLCNERSPDKTTTWVIRKKLTNSTEEESFGYIPSSSIRCIILQVAPVV
jgi:hypothetical protein